MTRALSAVLVVIGLAIARADATSDLKHQLVGTWHRDGGDYTVTFAADGTCAARRKTTMRCTYTWVDASTISWLLRVANHDEEITRFSIAIDGDTLTMTVRGRHPETFTRLTT